MRSIITTVAFGVLSVSLIFAQPPAEKRMTIPDNFRSFMVVDNRFPPKVIEGGKTEPDARERTDRMHDLIVEQALSPTVAIFSFEEPGTGSSTAKLVQELQPIVAKNVANNLGAFVIYLRLDNEYPFAMAPIDGDPLKGFVREQEAEAIREMATSLKTPNIPFGLASQQADSKFIKSWSLNPDETLTVVLYDRMLQVQRWDFSVNSPLTAETIQTIVQKADSMARGDD